MVMENNKFGDGGVKKNLGKFKLNYKRKIKMLILMNSLAKGSFRKKE
jgi:hypothetical protein